MHLLDDKTGLQKYESRVSMPLHNAKMHRPSAYISAKVNYEPKMLEFEELAGHIPRSNLPLTRRGKRDTSYTGTFAKMSRPKAAPQREDMSGSLNEIAVRSLVCSRCKLSAAQISAEAIKTSTKHAAKDKQRSDRRANNTLKPGQNRAHAEGHKDTVHFQPEKTSSGKFLPSSRQNWRVSEKTGPNVNRLISFLYALDDLPRKQSHSQRQAIGYQQPSGPKRRAKLSKPRRMADAGELFFLQAGELSIRKILVKEDEVLSGLLHVNSKRPTPQHTGTRKLTPTTPVGSTASEQSERVPDIHKRGLMTSKGKEPKQSSEYNNDIHIHQNDVPEAERIAQGRAGHRNHRGQMLIALEHSFSEGVETPRPSSLPPLYTSHHSTACCSHKPSMTKQAGGALPREIRKGKDHPRHPSSCLRDCRKRNGESVVTERRSSVSKRALPPIVMPRVTTPLRGFTPWSDATSSPCMLNSTTEDC